MARFIRVANASDVPPGTMRSFEVLYDRILIVNWQGTFFATQDLCTHDNGSLADGKLVDGQIECPRHGGRFDPATGAATQMPAMFPIKTFPVKVEGDSIWVAI
ncbi:MAG: non-heme iron oxygenase ferredoxin subunit [Anaerolineae bacterium]|nr:non-heme iron oxygenase ferredoxin subunit [Anaerolineae bacterium]